MKVTMFAIGCVFAATVCLADHADAAKKGMTHAQAFAACKKKFPKGTARGGKLFTIRENCAKELMSK